MSHHFLDATKYVFATSDVYRAAIATFFLRHDVSVASVSRLFRRKANNPRELPWRKSFRAPRLMYGRSIPLFHLVRAYPTSIAAYPTSIAAL